MKSTKKITYNHRFAQSKESWETNFLSKINSGNSLLYLAALKSNNYAKPDDKYYTEENKPKILSTLDGIVNAPYNQRFHKVFETYLDAAKAKLDEIIARNASSAQNTQPRGQQQPQQPQVQQQTNANPGISVTEDAQGQTQFTSSVRTMDGDEIRDIFARAQLILDNDPQQFRQLWPNMRKQVVARWAYIDENEKNELNSQLRNFDLKINLMNNPQGGYTTSRGTFFAYRFEDLVPQLYTALRKNDVTQANDIISRIQVLRDKEPDSYISESRKINSDISRFNASNTGTDATKVNRIN